MRAAGKGMGKAAYGALWCFVLVLPWDVFVNLPVVGSIPRIVGLVASAGGVLYILARRSLTPLSWFHMFAGLFVLWAGVSSFWSIDPEATRTRVITYLQLVVLVWLIWEIAWSSARQRALFQAYVVGASVAALVTIHNFLSGALSVLAALVGLSIIPLTLGRLRLRAKAALYALAAGSLVVASNVVPESSFARIASTRADIEAGHFGGRGAIWMAGLEVAREHPLVGVGAGAFQAAVEPTIHEEMVAHNVLLSVLVEDGLVGLLLFVAMITAVLGPVRHLPPVQRRFSIVLLLALALGSMSLSWDNRKQLWFVVGALAVQVAPRPVQTRPSFARASTV